MKYKSLNITKTVHTYSPFHKTLPISSLQIYWISVRFYEMGDIWIINKEILHLQILQRYLFNLFQSAFEEPEINENMIKI